MKYLIDGKEVELELSDEDKKELEEIKEKLNLPKLADEVYLRWKR